MKTQSFYLLLQCDSETGGLPSEDAVRAALPNIYVNSLLSAALGCPSRLRVCYPEEVPPNVAEAEERCREGKESYDDHSSEEDGAEQEAEVRGIAFFPLALQRIAPASHADDATFFRDQRLERRWYRPREPKMTHSPAAEGQKQLDGLTRWYATTGSARAKYRASNRQCGA
jgi:hypothetical protein